MKTKKKPVIYIAGDSTAQSYSESARPQTGWGECLLPFLCEGQEVIEESHRENCPFEQEKRYESENLIVDNCAMAGRSSRTFREEGRLSDIEAQIQEGDYLLIQFGHNDASASKPERFVSVENFAESLMYYVDAARKVHATPVLISSIALRPCQENTVGDVGEIARLLPLYAREMEKLAERENLCYLNLGAKTQEACKAVGEAVTKLWYKEDNVHLVLEGAQKYAGLLAELIKSEGRLSDQ